MTTTPSGAADIAAARSGEGPVCPLCVEVGGVALWSDKRLRVTRVDDTPAYPAFYRVIWNAHVKELTDLSRADLHYCIDAVAKVERVLRAQLSPTKVNVASLGNQVPHLHWHVVPRFEWDAHFPTPIWSVEQRVPAPEPIERLRALLPGLDRAVVAALHQVDKPALKPTLKRLR